MAKRRGPLGQLFTGFILLMIVAAGAGIGLAMFYDDDALASQLRGAGLPDAQVAKIMDLKSQIKTKADFSGDDLAFTARSIWWDLRDRFDMDLTHQISRNLPPIRHVTQMEPMARPDDPKEPMAEPSPAGTPLPPDIQREGGEIAGGPKTAEVTDKPADKPAEEQSAPGAAMEPPAPMEQGAMDKPMAETPAAEAPPETGMTEKPATDKPAEAAMPEPVPEPTPEQKPMAEAEAAPAPAEPAAPPAPEATDKPMDLNNPPAAEPAPQPEPEQTASVPAEPAAAPAAPEPAPATAEERLAAADLTYKRALALFADAKTAEQKAEAAKLFAQAAIGGHPGAQYSIGVMHYNGTGVAKDYTKAAEWFGRAAEKSNAAAQYNLGILYYNGQGVPKDDRLAYKWISAAAENGDQKAIVARDALKQALPAEITKPEAPTFPGAVPAGEGSPIGIAPAK
jgi:hypothetical protein